MATIFVNGCFDILHEGHIAFLKAAKNLGGYNNTLIVAVNSGLSARRLKLSKWGERYPIDSLETRLLKLKPYADERRHFATESELEELIWYYQPCIICKGPDYIGKRVTGDLIAPVVILQTPEPESVKLAKIELYGQSPR